MKELENATIEVHGNYRELWDSEKAEVGHE